MPHSLMSTNESENVKITTVNVEEESSQKSNDIYSISRSHILSYSKILVPDDGKEMSDKALNHAMRTKEYELRNALYFAILERLRLRKPQMLEFSRLEFNGLPVSKRKIKRFLIYLSPSFYR